ncbi:MAG: PulJ/GspJ family protein [Candidatus Xenobia bacterium]
MTCRTSGYTLIEVLVACGLAVLVGLMGWQLLRPVLTTSRHAAEQAVLQQQALVINDRLDADFARTTPTAFDFRASATQAILAFIRLSDAPWAGSLQWEPQLILYHWSPPRLERRVLTARDNVPAWLSGQLSQPLRDPVLQDIAPLAAIAASETLLLSDHVPMLKIETTAPPLQFPFTLKVTLQDNQEQYQMVRSFTLQNWQ